MSDFTNAVVLQTRNPDDLSVDDLDQLALTVRSALPSLPVIVETKPPCGPGHSWTDVLYVLLPTADWIRDQYYDALRDLLVAAWRKRFSRKYEQSRPRVIVFEDRSTGEIVVTIALKNAENDPVVRHGD